MAWFIDKLKAGIGKKHQKTEADWIDCPKCEQNNFLTELDNNLKVCPQCEYHYRLNAMERISLLVNHDSFQEHDSHLFSADPLKFKDKKKYRERIKLLQKKGKTADAVICGTARLGNHEIQIGSFEFEFMGGSMGSVVGEKITRAIERCIQKRDPLILISCSGGARMQEGIFSLMQMAKTSSALQNLSAQRIPYISILSDPTMGGVSASFSMLGDIILAEPGAILGFAGPRVIEQTIQQKLPDGFQTAEFLLEHGLIDNVVHRKNLKPVLENLLNLLTFK